MSVHRDPSTPVERRLLIANLQLQGEVQSLRDQMRTVDEKLCSAYQNITTLAFANSKTRTRILDDVRRNLTRNIKSEAHHG